MMKGAYAVRDHGCQSVSSVQTGKGYLQPNDAFGTPNVVKYGMSASNLNMTATGTAQAGVPQLCRSTVHSVHDMAMTLMIQP